AIAVHCGAGIGRTGTFLAAYLVWRGMKPDEAITLVREKRPGSIETEEQEAVVRLFSESVASQNPDTRARKSRNG
ncbi:MAG: dual specificity protein phosphatase family protein, partial [Planctomycetes bacterium]|nr:dual specificity protein phosphatase family protein [Planctomycetota bacterium]